MNIMYSNKCLFLQMARNVLLPLIKFWGIHINFSVNLMGIIENATNPKPNGK